MYSRQVRIQQSALLTLGGKKYEVVPGEERTFDFGNYNQYRRLVMAGLCVPTNDSYATDENKRTDVTPLVVPTITAPVNETVETVGEATEPTVKKARKPRAVSTEA